MVQSNEAFLEEFLMAQEANLDNYPLPEPVLQDYQNVYWDLMDQGTGYTYSYAPPPPATALSLYSHCEPLLP